jgi:hypothetical protein
MCVVTMFYHLVFDYAKFRIRPWCGISALIEEERVWRAPPTLDAKHLWFMNLEDLCFQL